LSLGLLPYCFIWVLFSFLYIFVPNTKVNFSAGAAAGIVTGTIYQLVQWVYIKFQIGLAGYNAIYGGFAALPLFLVWLQTSWTIVLFGAVFSRACQTVHLYDFDTGLLDISHALKKLLVLRIVQVIVKNFQAGEPPVTADALAERIEIPHSLLQNLLDELSACGILSETMQQRGAAVCYQPAKSTEALTLAAVIEALEQHGAPSVHMADSAELEALSLRLGALTRHMAESPDNVCVKDI
jgi:membrane protein